ncbi:MAG: hypothetical protein IAI49_05665 [Candidatus Eremiobacteraeota bacterium]|nr:hypothetical protein [Candidatus Eremiobacteraeota bacterium]
MAIGTGTDPSGQDALDELLKDIANPEFVRELQDIDPEAFREAEFEQTQAILDTLRGKQIAKAIIEDARIVIETTDGNRYFFFGFMASAGPQA